jgi:hypothetical protein
MGGIARKSRRAGDASRGGATLVPTLRVGTHVPTHRVVAPSDRAGPLTFGTQSVRACVPTRSVGTRKDGPVTPYGAAGASFTFGMPTTRRW